MKALSIQQPWAWAILHAGKDVENRRWSTPFRGEFAIHASATQQNCALPRGVRKPAREELTLQAIVGVANLVDVVEKSSSRWFIGKYGFVLANVRSLPEPIPCKGNLRFWDVPPSVVRGIRQQLEPVAKVGVCRGEERGQHEAVQPARSSLPRHFVVYHNVEKMGQQLTEVDRLSIFTNKPVVPLLHQVVWLIGGEGRNPRRFSLGSVFMVNEVGEATEPRFRHFARGQGHLFTPPIPLQELEWFPRLLKSVGNFQFGMMEAKDQAVIGALERLAVATAPFSSPGVWFPDSLHSDRDTRYE